MAKKKTFAKGIDAILGGSSQTATLDKKAKKENSDESLETPYNETENSTIDQTEPLKLTTKTTLRLEDELLDTVRALAYWERKSMTEVISDALRTYFKSVGEERIETAINAHKS